MPDLKSLSPQALRAAMMGGTEAWGEWGSSAHHSVYVEPVNLGRHWRKCRCGCGKRATHHVAANGVALLLGCEFKAHQFARYLRARAAQEQLR